MPTMSHTKEQRKNWHKGKGLDASGFLHELNRGNYQGACTPPRFKRGIGYPTLKNTNKKGYRT